MKVQQLDIIPERAITPCQYLLAKDSRGAAAVFCTYFLHKRRWVVHLTGLPRSVYMFKDDGLFGCTENHDDMFENGFEHIDEAISAFEKFYPFGKSESPDPCPT